MKDKKKIILIVISIIAGICVIVGIVRAAMLGAKVGRALADYADDTAYEETLDAKDTDADDDIDFGIGDETSKEEADDDYIIERGGYSWDDIVEMNADERMIYLFNSDDYLIFLGNKYCDMKIEDEEDALKSLGYVDELIGLSSVNLSFYKKTSSPVTQNVYYTFYQTSKGLVNGQEMEARYYNYLVKVITDKDGNSLGLSADLYHDEDSKYTYDEFVTKEMAENEVQMLIGKDYKIYENITDLMYWEDDAIVSRVSQGEGKVVPAYFVYSDAPENSSGNFDSKPYEVFVVSAEYGVDEEGNPDVEILSNYFTSSLDPEAFYNVYTSDFFFDVLEDVGEYTYTVDLSWVKDSYEDYEGELHREVSVPVMKNRENGLYYLGSKKDYITVSNYYDFSIYSTLNPYVTDNPDDLDSWHFYTEGMESDGIKEYFNNPNFVLSAFETFYGVTNDFKNRYGLPSIDDSEMPILLNVYSMGSDEYPESVEEFEVNASNGGQCHDWATMSVSPMLAECLNPVVMGHEFTHGINSQLTSTHYFNEAGAIMESYADIIGCQMAMVNEKIDKKYYWQIAGEYAPTMRSMSDPEEYYQPKYIDGVYYIQPTGYTTGEVLDYGGVHQNSGVCNYLAYCLVNGHDDIKDGATLSMEDNLDMWFETLYMTNYVSDYYDVGQYLRFAAKCMALEEDEQDYISDLLVLVGIGYDEEGTAKLNVSEDYKTIELTVSAHGDEEEDYSYGVTLEDAVGTEVVCAGDFYAGETLEFKVKPDDNLTPCVYLGYEPYETVVCPGVDLTGNNDDKYEILYTALVLSPNESYSLCDSDEYFEYSASFADDYLSLDKAGSFNFEADEEGDYAIAISYPGEDDSVATYDLYYIVVGDEQ